MEGKILKNKELYFKWCELAQEPDIIEELNSIKENTEDINDRFYKDLEFGTGGLRGVIGAGTNRMNIYTVARATQGFANYINTTYNEPKVAIAYDSRIKSDLFAKTTASVFAANGIKVYIYKELMPTPMLSFAVRHLKCNAGVVVTASHNPSKYNGYKAYGPDGCQLNLEASEAVIDYISNVDIFNDVKKVDFNTAVGEGVIEYIGDDVINSYLDAVFSQSVNPDVFKNSDLKVIYTPLHGTGNKPVRAILKKAGISNIKIVPEQELPDGNFPTAPYPNPEIRDAFNCALNLSKEYAADILLATDPDADRVGIAVKNNGEYTLMTGNEVGALLLDYIIKSRIANNTLPKNPIAVKTIVTSGIAEKIAKKYGCTLKNVLTGFKFIGEIILGLETEGNENDFIYGYEESYGYLSGSYVRDKDAVVASLLICEMACYYKQQGLTLIDVMNNLYDEHGYFCNEQVSFTCEGASGMERMADIMNNFRNNIPEEIADYNTIILSDYLNSKEINLQNNTESLITLPRSNVLAFTLENGSKIIIRPSGTEPKIKVYIEAVSDTLNNSHDLSNKLKEDISKKMGF